MSIRPNNSADPEPLEAILLVGGQGTRLRPLTIGMPKPLLPTAGVPFLAHQLARAAMSGVTRVVLATAYRAEMFEESLGVVLNGDILSGHDLAAQLDLHCKADAAVTLHLVEVPDPARFGCVPTDSAGRVTAFLEKTPDPVTNRINAGCYVFRRQVIDEIPAGRVASVERETFPALIDAGAVV